MSDSGKCFEEEMSMTHSRGTAVCGLGRPPSGHDILCLGKTLSCEKELAMVRYGREMSYAGKSKCIGPEMEKSLAQNL